SPRRGGRRSARAKGRRRRGGLRPGPPRWRARPGSIGLDAAEAGADVVRRGRGAAGTAALPLLDLLDLELELRIFRVTHLFVHAGLLLTARDIDSRTDRWSWRRCSGDGRAPYARSP